MNIAVLSGKGGTGKTLISVNLADAITGAAYIDCDVEAPNGGLYFKPYNMSERSVNVKIPKIDTDKCNGCRTCVEFCKFNALAYIMGEVKVFDEICHACGGCALLCPKGAIEELTKSIGTIKVGESEGHNIITGIMNIGEASGVPIIREALKNKNRDSVNIIDCPPGSACIVMESIKDADYCVLVAEPSVFGASNLEMVHELVQVFNKPFGVVLNKCTEGSNPSLEYCNKNNIMILDSIDYDEKIGEINSNGNILTRVDSLYREKFKRLYNIISKGVRI